MSQSDIFSHFGAVKADTTGNSMKPPTSTSAPKSVGSRGKRATAAAAADELDDDERALADEEADEEDVADAVVDVVADAVADTVVVAADLARVSRRASSSRSRRRSSCHRARASRPSWPARRP